MLIIFAFLITIYLTAKELKNAERCGGDKMWYEDVVCQLNKEQVYTRQQIYEALVQKWLIMELFPESNVENMFYRVIQFQRNKFISH